ncbi:MAG TPA: NAD-dependent epimerase/dehydratase family protein, partial [Anaerolineae bacterium]
DLPVACLRLFTVYGPRQRPDMAFARFLQALAEGREIGVFGTGTQTRDFTFVGDVVQAFRLAMDDCRRRPGGGDGAGRVFNVAGGTRTSVLQVLADLAKITGREPILRYLPAQPGDVCDTWADTTRTQETLGWRPAVDLPDGLTAQWRALAGTNPA